MFYTVVQDNARLNSFHSVRDYLDNLKWDGVERIDKWLTTYGEAQSSEYADAVGALMLVAAVHRIRKPGCKFDEMMVLENEEQGTNKSSALAIMAVQEEWFSDDLPLNLEGKRIIESLQGRWIVEAAELSGMKRADIEHLKAFLSRQWDRARLAYARLPSEVPRQSIIVGTTNSSEYLRDLTGNRRFWPLRVGRFNLEALKRDRDQLWAEAAAREATGVSIRLQPELWPKAKAEQEQRLTQDPYYEKLLDVLADEQGKISSEQVWEILEMRTDHRGQDQSRRVSAAMHALGWRRTKTRLVKIKGKLMVGYVKGEQPWSEVQVNF
jgi:predicted P-loop ATPase